MTVPIHPHYRLQRHHPVNHPQLIRVTFLTHLICDVGFKEVVKHETLAEKQDFHSVNVWEKYE